MQPSVPRSLLLLSLPVFLFSYLTSVAPTVLCGYPDVAVVDVSFAVRRGVPILLVTVPISSIDDDLME